MSDLQFKDIPIPSGMTQDDCFCQVCYDEGRKQSKERKKQQKEEIKQEYQEQLSQLQGRVSEYKESWNKNGVIQFKNKRIAILQRSWGAQVEFIVAYDDLTKEGYRLMAIDEGKEASAGGITGGANAYFYFQKMEFVR